MTLWEFAPAFKPPRTVELDFPLGATLGRPHDAEQQRAVIAAALAALPSFRDGDWKTIVLPFSWSGDDRSWEETIKDLYRNDEDDTMQSHQAEHRKLGDVLAGNEQAFLERHLI